MITAGVWKRILQNTQNKVIPLKLNKIFEDKFMNENFFFFFFFNSPPYFQLQEKSSREVFHSFH